MYEYSIKCEVLNSGEKVFTPLVRPKSKFLGPNWTRIIKVYDRYVDMDIEHEPHLTEEECKQHIDGFANQIIEDNLNRVKAVSLSKYEPEYTKD